MAVNRFGPTSEEVSAKGKAVCRHVEKTVEDNPGVAVAVTAFAGLAAGLLVSGMVNDVVRSRRNAGAFGNWRHSLESALRNAVPADVKGKFS